MNLIMAELQLILGIKVKKNLAKHVKEIYYKFGN